MTPETFRHWLAERGCSFEQTARDRGEGIAEVVIRLGPRRSVLPMSASRKDLPDEVVRRIVDELDLPYEELPGPRNRS